MPKYILFLAKLKGEGKPFLEWKIIDLSYEQSLTYEYNVNHYKSVHHPIPTRENRGHLDNFQNKPVSSAFRRVSRYILVLDTLKEKGRPFLKVVKRGATCAITPKSTWLS